MHFVKPIKVLSKLVFVIAIAAGLFLSIKLIQNNQSPRVTISFSSEGFIPAELSIRKGQTVIFLNNSNTQVWPASDPHPTHSIYPQFDPQQPIDPGQSWQFTFERE